MHSATSSDFTEDQKVLINSFKLLLSSVWYFASVEVFFFLENYRKDCNMSGNEKYQFAGLCFSFFVFKLEVLSNSVRKSEFIPL